MRTKPVCLIALFLFAPGFLHGPSAGRHPDNRTGHISVGAEYLDFHDDRLGSLYGSPIGATLSGDLLQRPWMSLTAQAAFAFRTGSPAKIGFIQQTETRIYFVPVRLQWRLRQPIFGGWNLWGGPQVAWAWFREEWEASVPDAELFSERHATGSWLAVGGVAGLRAELGSAGALRCGFEWLWSNADREVVPRNDAQSTSMMAGWSSVSLAWELPWWGKQQQAEPD